MQSEFPSPCNARVAHTSNIQIPTQDLRKPLTQHNCKHTACYHYTLDQSEKALPHNPIAITHLPHSKDPTQQLHINQQQLFSF